MQVHVSSQVNEVIERAVALSVNRGQFFVGVEQIFAALLEDPDALPACIQQEYLSHLYTVMREVARGAWNGQVHTPEGEVFHTPRAITVTQRAGKLAERYGRGAATPGHVLLAILSDAYASPSRAMDRFGMDRGECINKLRAELTKGRPVPKKAAQANTGPAEEEAVSPVHQPPGLLDEAPQPAAAAKNGEGAPPLESLTRDLTALAREGRLDAAIGRDDEMIEILQVLTRKTKSNVMIVGDAGVGKTQVVEGLAVKMARGDFQNGVIPDFQILELNLAALMSGTQYRGAFEEKMLGLLDDLKRSNNTVLFIDEVHLIMGAGSTDDGSIDMANLLKPALARGEIRCVGATTLQEYRKFVERDPAIERRFQMVRIEELSEQATLMVLEKLRSSLERHHRVRIGSRALRAAVQLTQRYMPNRRQPDKAIDVLDHACARYRMKLAAFKEGQDPGQTITPTAESKVTPHDIRKVVSQITAIPIEEMTAEERLHLSDIDKRIMQRLIGQDEAVHSAVSSVKKSRAGLADPNRPDSVMLFLGPSGVGKSQLAKLLATELFGSRNHLITFDMSEYIEEHSVSRLLGAPPGYAGCEEEGRLSAAVRNTPFSLLLFDEIEKAHPRVFDVFLPIFDEGRIKDNRGREISFKNCIIILTSNIGSRLLYRSEVEDPREALMEELLKHFRPEFINRIDEIVPFYPLLAEDIRSILRLEINVVRARLREKRIGIRMFQRAYEYLAEEGYDPEYGARQLRRTVDKLITTPLSDKLLAGDVSEGRHGGCIDGGRQAGVPQRRAASHATGGGPGMKQPYIDLFQAINGPEDGAEYPVTRVSFDIGSDASCVVHLRMDPLVKYFNARATAVPDGYRVRRLTGAPVWVNGRRAGRVRSRVMRSGDILRVGQTELVLECVPGGVASRSRGLPMEGDVAWAARLFLHGLGKVLVRVWRGFRGIFGRSFWLIVGLAAAGILFGYLRPGWAQFVLNWAGWGIRWLRFQTGM